MGRRSTKSSITDRGAIDDTEKAIEVIETAQRHFPHLKIIARAKNWSSYERMYKLSVDQVYREYADTALRMGEEASSMLGYRKHQVHRTLKKFRSHDERLIERMAKEQHESKSFVQAIRKNIQDLELMMLEDQEKEAQDKDLGWDTESLKKEYGDWKKTQ